MGGGSDGSVPPLNANQVSADQTKSNVNTGISNAVLNNTNQVTPTGNLTYNQTGTTNVGGNDVPSYTATQTLSGPQQTILDKNQDLSIRALNAASPLLDRVATTIATPLNFNGAPSLRGPGVLNGLPQTAMNTASGLNYVGPSDPDTVRNNAYNALTSRSNVDLARTRDAQEVQLANQGIAQGSEAWKRAEEGQDRAVVDASNQATINAGTIASQDVNNAATIAGAKSQLAGTQGNLYSTAGNLENAGFNQDLTRRNQSINETEALRNSSLQDYQSLFGLSGGLTQPNFTSTPQGQIPMTDTTSPQIAAYQGRVQQAQNAAANSNATMGGLFGLGGSALMAGGMFL